MRDRLAELHQNMEGNGDKESDTFIQISKEPAPATMTEFFSEVNLIRQNLDEIEQETKTLQLIHRTINESTRPSEMLKKQAEDSVQIARSLAMKTTAQIKGLSSKLSDPLSTPCVRILSVQESTLGLRLKRAMEALYQEQQRQRDKSKAVLKRQLQVVRSSWELERGEQISDETLENLLDQNQSFFTGNIMNNTAELKRELEDIQTRHDELLELEKSIVEVHALFIEVSLLVQSQGEMVDNIERNVLNATDVVEQGRKELVVAEKKQTSSRKKKIFCGFFTALIIVIALLLLIFFVP